MLECLKRPAYKQAFGAETQEYLFQKCLQFVAGNVEEKEDTSFGFF